MKLVALSLSLCGALLSPWTASAQSDPSFDHQQKTYVATHKPVSIQGAELSLTPFFSPDHSIDTLVNLIEGAKETLDIMTPSIGSWIGCSSGSDCIGCDVDKMNGETFPGFPALLNAAHRGVKIRLITNNYNNLICDGDIDMVAFFALNGISIRWYQTTTFVHAKFVLVDGKLASISSVNWSQNSFTNNREAGVLVTGDGSGPAIDFVQSVFNQDWENGDEYKVTQTYSAAEMSVITKTAVRPVTVPDGPPDRFFITPVPKAITGRVDNFTVLTSPDYSFTTIMDQMNSATKSLEIYTYQITDPRVCDNIEALHKKGIDVTLLMSYAIYSKYDQADATKCYTQLTAAGLTVNLAWQYNDYMYCHNKFWIVDGTQLGLSTGNLSPSDMPGGSMTFPTFAAGGSQWRDANRDFHVFIEDPTVVAEYQKVIQQDLKNSTVFSGDTNTCKHFGCGKYVSGQPCQCNDQCDKYNNCCSDYQTTCG